MKLIDEEEKIFFVYDGECPICNYAAEATKIKKEYGDLIIIDARSDKDHKLIKEINRLGFDLDEGMVIYQQGEYYHGKEALKFIAKYGEAKNSFMCLFRSLFWSNKLSNILYPWMRGFRNYLINKKSIQRIDNLNLKNEPIFKSVFGKDWIKLPEVIKKHYSNRPYTIDKVEVKGVLEVTCRPPLLWLSFLTKMMGQIPAYNEAKVPVTVLFESEKDTKHFNFNRVFSFKDKKPYIFKSRMLQIKDDEVVEIMKYGFCWKMRYKLEHNIVRLIHKGYAIKLFGHFIPLPITWLLGSANAWEKPVDENYFDMKVNIVHPLWGKIYEYKGRFEVIS